MDDSGSQYAFVSPWMPNGDLVHYLKYHPDVDRTKVVRAYAYLSADHHAHALYFQFQLGEVALGLCYLHEFRPQVIHGDFRTVSISPCYLSLRSDIDGSMQANILVDAFGRPRITDFGLSRIIDSQASTSASSFSGQGNVRWQAPELLDTSRFRGGSGNVTTQSDVYSYAYVCLEVSDSYLSLILK